MRALLFLIVIGCGGSKAPAPSNSSPTGGSAAAATSGDCMGGGTVFTGGAPAADCKFMGEVMGPPHEGGSGIHMIKCCYPTAEAACKHAGGCELADCTFDDKAAAPAPVTCKDTTHGGVPTNP